MHFVCVLHEPVPVIVVEPGQVCGPAGLIQAYRFIMDSQDRATQEHLDDLNDPYRLFRCRTIMNCSEVLPQWARSVSCHREDQADDIELSIQARLQRRGRSVRLVVTPHAASATAVQKDQALIELLAQGQRWFEQWRRGEVASLRAIAQSVGKSERHVSQVIRAAFLAPDLVEALLQGRQPAQLTLRQVMKQLPWDWSEQRRRFGLASNTNDSLSVRD